MRILNDIRAFIERQRMRLAMMLFPKNGYSLCANRLAWKYSTDGFDVTMTFRNKEKPDAVSYEEMLRTLDTFIRRKATPKEWQTIMEWASK